MAPYTQVRGLLIETTIHCAYISRTAMPNINIMIIEDEVLVALDLEDRIQGLGYDVAAVRHNSEKALAYLEIHTPDLILCDINIKGEKDGIDIAQHVKDTVRIPLIFVTALSDRGTLERAKKTLPYGYIVKPFSDGDLLSAIELALYKHSLEFESLKLTKERINQITHSPVTDREYDMLSDLIEGLTNDQISKSRHISTSTVKFHINHLLEKMEVKNRAGALHKIIKLLT